jgi:hypothetical protein
MARFHGRQEAGVLRLDVYGYIFSRMKTTVELPDELLVRAKKRAVETRTPLRVLIERGLRRELASSSVGRRALTHQD